jgi:hypothetical protein
MRSGDSHLIADASQQCGAFFVFAFAHHIARAQAHWQSRR